MSKRKGELNSASIDRDWPFQIALRVEACRGDNYVTIRLFCEPLSLCNRGHFFRRGDESFNVFCFADLAHAERFKEKYGGELIAVKDRPRWPGK